MTEICFCRCVSCVIFKIFILTVFNYGVIFARLNLRIFKSSPHYNTAGICKWKWQIGVRIVSVFK